MHIRKYCIPALIALTVTISAWAKPVDLTPFKGAYTGSVTYTNADAGSTGTGAISAVFSTTKKGRTGSLVLSGTVNLEGTVTPLNETLTFTNGSLNVSDFAPLVVEPQAIFGTYTGTKKGTTLTSSIPWSYMGSTTGTDTFTISVKKSKKVQTLTVTLVLGVNGGLPNFLTVTWTATKKVKK